MKKYFIIIWLFFLINDIHSQAEYVPSGHSVYSFLERMENKNIINEYNSFDIPKTRSEIINYLTALLNHKSQLGKIDVDMLNDFSQEFQIFPEEGESNVYQEIIGNGHYDLFSQKEKYFYYLADPDFNIFVNLKGEAEYLDNRIEHGLKNNAAVFNAGGIIRGTIKNKFGYYIEGSNGLLSGNKEVGLINRNLKQNFKYTEKPDERFFDETQGHLTADFELIKFKIGRDRIRTGYGELSIIDDYSPAFDYLGMKINYKFFSYSFYHAKILDLTVNNGGTQYSDKFLVYHRIGFNLNRHIDFGAGEFVLYSRRGPDISYLNPFAFYKSIEHSNRDRDNTMLFFDVNNNSLAGLKLHFTLLIDDITYGKIGTGWYGNQVLINSGFFASNIFNLPADLKFDYRRTEPYTFSHRFSYNNFTNLGFSLGTYSMPNSEVFSLRYNHRLNYRLEFTAGISYIRHGANPETMEGIINVGGDINLGFRTGDSEKVKFLAGNIEYYRLFNFAVRFEPYNQIVLNLNLNYLNNSAKTKASHREIQTFFSFSTLF